MILQMQKSTQLICIAMCLIAEDHDSAGLGVHVEVEMTGELWSGFRKLMFSVLFIASVQQLRTIQQLSIPVAGGWHYR